MIKNLFYLISSLTFLIAMIFFYFSDENIKSTNKNRSFYLSVPSIEGVDYSHYTFIVPNDDNLLIRIVEYETSDK